MLASYLSANITGLSDMSQSTRKFTTEFLLGIVVHIDWMSRPQELAQLQAIDFERPPHLYIIASLPLVSIKPETVRLDGEFMEGFVKLHNGPRHTVHHFRTKHDLGPGCTLHSEWPHDEYEIRDSNDERVAWGVVASIGYVATHEWPIEARNFEVLYVGQAYGTEGDRIAPDRLAAHATLQKILAECPRDRQIWLIIGSISDENLFIEIDPRVPALTTDAEDKEHIRTVTQAVECPEFRETQSVSLAEAAMIRYFQPPYNDIFKRQFPGRRHTILESLRRLDLLALVVEVQAQHMPLFLGSASVPSALYHEAKFYIHLDGTERQSDWAMRDFLSAEND